MAGLVTAVPARALWATVAFGVAAAVLFVAVPQVDLAVAQMLYLGDGQFLLSGSPVADLWMRATRLLARLVVIGLAVGLILTLVSRRAVFGLDWRRYVFLLLCFGVGAGVVANAVFKENWGRARPSQVVEFGGEKRFTPAFAISDQCPRNCSFVSGDSAFAFGTLGFALLVGRYRCRYAAAALGLGLVVGAGRMLTGSHFLSDIVFSGVFTVLSVFILHWLLLSRPPPTSA